MSKWMLINAVIVVISVIGVVSLPFILIPRNRAATPACIANLKQIEGAKETWLLEEKKVDAIPTWNDLVPNYIRVKPVCEANGVYTIGSIDQRPSCSFKSHCLEESRKVFQTLWDILR